MIWCAALPRGERIPGVEAIPKTATGEFSKRELRERINAHTDEREG